MKKLVMISFVLVAGIIGCKKAEMVETITQNDVIVTPVNDTIGVGDFIGVDHSLAGTSILFKDTSGNYILRLENFTMTAAPDADILLSKTSNYVAGDVIKVYDLTQNANYNNNSINIDVDNTINFSEYPYVIAWCEQFSAYFGHAHLE